MSSQEFQLPLIASYMCKECACPYLDALPVRRDLGGGLDWRMLLGQLKSNHSAECHLCRESDSPAF